jgi:hypothetical protein
MLHFCARHAARYHNMLATLSESRNLQLQASPLYRAAPQLRFNTCMADPRTSRSFDSGQIRCEDARRDEAISLSTDKFGVGADSTSGPTTDHCCSAVRLIACPSFEGMSVLLAVLRPSYRKDRAGALQTPLNRENRRAHRAQEQRMHLKMRCDASRRTCIQSIAYTWRLMRSCESQ